MIGDTASISLLTGLPGSGKSLRIAEAISTLVAKGEHVYYNNIPGLSIKGTTPWPDPCNWRDLPSGAILFVDEAQEFFPARRGGDPPDSVMMNRIRHLGIRIVLVSQQPNYLDTHLRGLVGYHEHLLRKSGKEASFIFRNNQVIDEVRAALPRIKTLYDYENWKFPKKYFSCYKSAEVHTVRYQMPALVKRALMVAPVAVVLALGAWYGVFRDSHLAKKDAPEAKTAALPPSGSGASVRPGAQRVTVESADDYGKQFTPLVDGVAWSAPAFLNRPVVAQPRAFCVLAGEGEDANGERRSSSWTCLSEQGSKVLMQAENVQHLARWGEPYNPFKTPEPSRQDSRGATALAGAVGAPAPTPNAVSGTVIEAGQVSGYGDIGVGKSDAALR